MNVYAPKSPSKQSQEIGGRSTSNRSGWSLQSSILLRFLSAADLLAFVDHGDLLLQSVLVVVVVSDSPQEICLAKERNAGLEHRLRLISSRTYSDVSLNRLRCYHEDKRLVEEYLQLPHPSLRSFGVVVDIDCPEGNGLVELKYYRILDVLFQPL